MIKNDYSLFVKNEFTLLKIVVDIFLVTVVLISPVISHKFHLPLYLIEPMRLAVVYAFLFDSKHHAMRLAITLPLLSFLFNGHPILLKAILISIELLVQVLMNDFLKQKSTNLYLNVIISIILSKIFYYLIKMVFIQLGLIGGVLVSTNLIYQLIPIFILIVTCFIFFPKSYSSS